MLKKNEKLLQYLREKGFIQMDDIWSPNNAKGRCDVLMPGHSMSVNYKASIRQTFLQNIWNLQYSDEDSLNELICTYETMGCHALFSWDAVC